MLAKNVNDNADILNERGALKFFASKLAPTVGRWVDLLRPRRPTRVIQTDQVAISA